MSSGGTLTRNSAEKTAEAILAGFEDYQRTFFKITQRARLRFDERDWHGAQHDALERLELYGTVVSQVVGKVGEVLGEKTKDKSTWSEMKTFYSQWIEGRGDFELAETFFNSITRRIFATIGVNQDIEFVDSDFDHHTFSPVYRIEIYRTYFLQGSLQDLLRNILAGYTFQAPFENLDRDINLAAAFIETHLRRTGEAHSIRMVEFLKPVFYRSTGAYLFGRARLGAEYLPLLFSLRHLDSGIVIDAVLMSQADISIVFSFTRSYFHVEAARPHQLVEFLRSLMPRKKVAELYISLGYNKHGKTELYRDFLRHLENSHDKFSVARGEKGMVMLVFTLPSYDLVFKIIRDHFQDPKTSTRQEVMDRYQLVFKHDRAGRLVDAQEFEHVKFEKSRFSDELLQELLEGAPNSVTVEGNTVAVSHLYTERRLLPLNLYVKEVPFEAAVEAAVDYGQAIKDLAATNIFPGDILLKNFGVTRHGRVVFYDYDELCLLTTCRFRSIPAATSYGDELASEPWFYVDSKDIFPEELKTFLGLQGKLRQAFLDAHGELFTAKYWRKMQNRLKAGEVVDIDPYSPSKKLNRK
jgi:isocitrate dehydrogenase kinase/phosphatase